MTKVSPRFDGGSGLKLSAAQQQHRQHPSLPSFRRGERIETADHGSAPGTAADVSPRFDGGSGLKRVRSRDRHSPLEEVSPRFDGGSGLKLLVGTDRSSLLSRSPLVSTGGAD